MLPIPWFAQHRAAQILRIFSRLSNARWLGKKYAITNTASFLWLAHGDKHNQQTVVNIFSEKSPDPHASPAMHFRRYEWHFVYIVSYYVTIFVLLHRSCNVNKIISNSVLKNYFSVSLQASDIIFCPYEISSCVSLDSRNFTRLITICTARIEEKSKRWKDFISYILEEIKKEKEREREGKKGTESKICANKDKTRQKRSENLFVDTIVIHHIVALFSPIHFAAQ